jgi:hypothetical protein
MGFGAFLAIIEPVSYTSTLCTVIALNIKHEQCSLLYLSGAQQRDLAPKRLEKKFT